jgi:chromosome segregation ATPase
MGATLTLSIVEIILLFFGAIILGITIHFTIASRRNMKGVMSDKDEINKFRDEWKSRYFNDVEVKDKELSTLRQELNHLRIEMTSIKEQLAEAEENTNIYTIEAEEMRKENKRLQLDLTNSQQPSQVMAASTPATQHFDKSNYLEQLRIAQSNLLEHNEKINQLLENIDLVKENEQKQMEILRSNEELSMQIAGLKSALLEKEKEIESIKQREQLTKEMTSMLDNAYSEFNVLQGKMQKLELQVSSSKMINMEYEDLKETYQKMNREFDQQKQKLTEIGSNNQQLTAHLIEAEEKLREANFHRQQLQKRVAYLEELNSDMQAVSDANKKLEGQLKRIGELESMLHVVAEERDQLIEKTK